MSLIKKVVFLSMISCFPFFSSPAEATFNRIITRMVAPPKTAEHLLRYWIKDRQIAYDAIEADESSSCCARICQRNPFWNFFYPNSESIKDLSRNHILDYLTVFLEKVRFLETKLSQPDFPSISEQALTEFQAYWKDKSDQFQSKILQRTETSERRKRLASIRTFDEIFQSDSQSWKSTLLTVPMIQNLRTLPESPILNVLSTEQDKYLGLQRTLQDLKDKTKVGSLKSKITMNKVVSLWTRLPHTRVAREAETTQFLFEYGNELYQLGAYRDIDSILALQDIRKEIGSIFPANPAEPELLVPVKTALSIEELEPKRLDFKSFISTAKPSDHLRFSNLSQVHEENPSQTYLDIKNLWKEFGLIETVDGMDCFRFEDNNLIFELGCYWPKDSSLIEIRKDLTKAGLGRKVLRKLQVR